MKPLDGNKIKEWVRNSDRFGVAGCKEIDCSYELATRCDNCVGFMGVPPTEKLRKLIEISIVEEN